MKVTGHSKYSTFLKYVQKDSDDHLDTFNDYYKLLQEQNTSENKKAPLKIVKRG